MMCCLLNTRVEQERKEVGEERVFRFEPIRCWNVRKLTSSAALFGSLRSAFWVA